MSVEGARQRMQSSFLDLKAQWDRASQVWQDAAAKTLRERYLDELEQAVRTALPALEKMAEALARARQECDDPR